MNQPIKEERQIKERKEIPLLWHAKTKKLYKNTNYSLTNLFTKPTFVPIPNSIPNSFFFFRKPSPSLPILLQLNATFHSMPVRDFPIVQYFVFVCNAIQRQHLKEANIIFLSL